MPAKSTAGPAMSAAQPEQNAEQRGNAERGTRSAESGEVADRTDGADNGSSTDVSNEELARHLNLPAGVAEQLKKSPPPRKATADSSGPAESGTDEEGNADREVGSAESEEEEEREENAERLTPNAQRRTEESASAEAMADSSSRDATGEEGEEDHEEGIPEFIKGIKDPKLQRKLEKRFGRFTRKVTRLEDALERQEQELGQYREQHGAQAQRAAEAAPQKGGVLGSARTERDLDGMISYAENLIEQIDANPEGMTSGEGDQAKFYPPEEIAKWRRGAEKVLLGSERRRRELREHAAERQSYDTAARKDFPEVMKKDTPEFQTAVKLAGRYPWVCDLPEANYALGLMVEGFKALNGRVKGQSPHAVNGKTPNAERPTPNGGNGRGGEEDLDERLTPEYQRDHIPPTAAAIPSKPQRSPASAGLNAKKADKIAANFTRPGGATATTLASAFVALDDEEEMPSRRKVAV